MRILWDTIETVDHAAITVLTKMDRWLGRDDYKKRTEKAVEHVRPPQKAISFDN